VSEIKNIIFDLGGVILNLNYQLTIDAFKDLGFKNFESFYTQKQQTDFFNAFETGKLNKGDFFDFIKTNCSANTTSDQIKDAWNSMLLDLPEYRIKFLEKLNKTHSIYLLSNTNEIHIESFKKIINKSIGYNRFKKTFKACYYSSEIGLRKPDESCFRFVLEQNKLIEDETLFIDDSIQHINGANSIGIKTHFLNPEEDIIKVVPDIIQ